MNETNAQEAIQRIEQSQTMALDAVGRRAAIDDLLNKVALVQEVMQRVMKENEHYGVIPGCGSKPSLLKAGAEKLGMTFRLRPQFQVTERDLGLAHREYYIVCTLSDGTQGVGSCSTMETKYRFRGGERKCPDCGKAAIIKGKKEYGGGWICFEKKGGCGHKWPDGDQAIEGQSAERVEHDNPADYYNTCLKMGKKRAHVDAIITATACSDIFTQDVEEQLGERVEAASEAKAKAPTPPPASKPAAAAPKPAAKDGTYPVVTVLQLSEKSGTSKKNGKPWKAWFIKFSDGFGELEAGTFDTKIAELANELASTQESAVLVTKAGYKPGTFEIVSLKRADAPPPSVGDDPLPMDFDAAGNAIDAEVGA